MSGNFRRHAGILLHLSSLPASGPIGSMGEQARGFVDFLNAAGQTVWQVLPLTPPARGNSPYSSLSVFAGNPYFIDLHDLEAQGILPAGSCSSLPAAGGAVDYEACRLLIPPLLRLAFKTGYSLLREQIAEFRDSQRYWLEDYALFMALKDRFDGAPRESWPLPLLLRDPSALQSAAGELRDEIDYRVFEQYLFFSQWSALRRYANERGVRIIGDMPIYASLESADVWAHDEIFMLDENKKPALIAGVPPDYFSEKGQLWENPLYDWDEMRRQGFSWWIERLRVASEMYDTTRIDHFRGLSTYWAIPVNEDSAINGSWRPGPGMDFFNAIRNSLPHCSLIAEDLGLQDDGVRNLLRQSGLPGLAVLLFAFNTEAYSAYLPHSITPDCVAYIGTHDNDTAIGWLQTAPPGQVSLARDYMGLSAAEGEHWGFIRTLMGCAAETTVIQMQDLLGLDNAARMNVPSQPEGNWTWRLPPNALTHDITTRLRHLTRIYQRFPGSFAPVGG